MSEDEAEGLAVTLSLADSAYQLILVRILDGRLEPGSTLSVPALARTLDMGRSPVREAVQRLVYEGIAENALNRGAAVTRVRPEDLPDIFEAKEPLEGLAAKRAASRMGEAQRTELLEMVDRQERILGEPYLSSTLMRLDIEFHHFYAHHSESAALEDALRLFTTRTHLVVPSMWTQSDLGARNSVIEHREIAAAIAAGDEEAAELAARLHTQNVCSRLVDWLHATQTAEVPAGRVRR
jgi:DNA-binding GntR family transcriptional regulator